MPLVAIVTIVLGVLLALTLVGAVAVIMFRLLRTSAVLADIDDALVALPTGLSGLDPTIARINRALGSLLSG